MSKQGWVSIYRKLFDNPLFVKYPEWIAPFIYMICLAEYEGNLKGCLYTTRRKLAQKFHLTEGNIITMFRNLLKGNMLEVLSKNDPRSIQDRSKYLIVNYDSYQENDPRMIQDRSKIDPEEGKDNLYKKNNIISKPKNQKPEPSENGKNFAKWFLDTYIDLNITKPSDSDVKKWAFEYDKLINIDKRTKKQISEVVQWAKSDEFWQDKFGSPLKMRRKSKDGMKFFDLWLSNMASGSKTKKAHDSSPVLTQIK